MRRVVILGRGGAGKSSLTRRLGSLTGLPVIDLDALFWQPDLTPASPPQWDARQRLLAARPAWIMDGDLGPYDSALGVRLRAADTVIVLDFSLPRCAWRTVRRGRERAGYWRWLWAYRRTYRPAIMRAIREEAPQAQVHVLHGPAAVEQFLAKFLGLAPDADHRLSFFDINVKR